MLVFHSLLPGLFRPDRSSAVRRIMFALCLVFIAAALLFTGCKMDDGFVDDGKLNSNLIGTWLDIQEWGIDGYTITSNRLTYISEWFPVAGTVRHVKNFSNSSGVIIIEYDPEYHNPAGNFIGIYFQNIHQGVSVQMGTAWTEEGAEEPTLAAAIAVFTVGNESTYISYYGTYFWTPE